MERTSVQKLAQVLRAMVMIVFVCNIAVLFLIPGLAGMRNYGGAGAVWRAVAAALELRGYEGQKLISLPMYFSAAFIGVWADTYCAVLTVFLWACGVCTAAILWQARRVLGNILKGEPFSLNNADSLKRAAVCCFIISGAALVRTVWGLLYYRSAAPLLTYNTLFVPAFLVAGLGCMVMSALFRQAAELKAESDLTI